MPRHLRLDVPGGTHHVVAKGNAGEALVRDDFDRRTLFTRMARAVNRFRWSCLAYCLMDTHLHLVVGTPEPTLSKGMQWLCGRYAQEFNARHQRTGHLFEGRFYSGLIRGDAHLLAAIAYVLANPVRAGLSRHAEDWAWSSYAATAGLAPSPSFLDVGSVLELVDPRPDVARMRLARIVANSTR